MSEKVLLHALQKKLLASPPVWFMRQAGRYLPEYRDLRAKNEDFLAFCNTPKLAVEASLQPLRRFDLDGAIIFSDILVIPAALGQKVWFEKGEGPKLEALKDEKDIAGLQLDGLEDRLQPLAESLSDLSAKIPDHVASIGFAGAPWTLAAYMTQGGGSKAFEATKLFSYQQTSAFQVLIEILVEAVSRSLLLQALAGAEVLMLFDSWAGLLPQSGFYRWCLDPVDEIARRVKAKFPDVPLIYFPRGAGSLYSLCVEENLPVDALSLDPSHSDSWAANFLQPFYTLQGNLDPLALVAGGEAMEQEIHRILDAFGEGPFVFNLGHGIIPQTPPEHVKRAIEIIRAYRVDMD